MGRSARIGVLVASLVAIVAAVVLAFVFAQDGKRDPVPNPDLVTVRALVGSEKAPLLHDQAVIDALAAQGLQLQIDTAGSRSMMAANPDSYDLFFPASAPVADQLTSAIPGARAIPAFQTPLVVLTFSDIKDVLEANGLVSTDAAGTPVFDVAAYLDALAKDTRWNSLTDNTACPSSKTVMVTTTEETLLEDETLTRIRTAFVDQGYKQSSTEGPFEDYLALGKQKTPLLLAYESQLLSRQLAQSAAVTDQMVALYPEPGMFSQHVVVARTENGVRVGELLTQDPALTAAVARYGFHPQSDPGAFAVEPPGYTVLDSLAAAVSPDPSVPVEEPTPSTATTTVAGGKQ